MNIEKEIDHQIAHCMAFYGDQPYELMFKLKCLVLEWYSKGQNIGQNGIIEPKEEL